MSMEKLDYSTALLRQQLQAAQQGHTPCILLDGGMGTELTARGYRSSLPLWSAEALLTPKGQADVLAVHQAYVDAGADVITVNSFRTTPRPFIAAFAEESSPEDARQKAHDTALLACGLAHEAAATATDRKAWVAGALTTLEDGDQPNRIPDDHTLYQEHRQQIAILQSGGVDFVLAETMISKREAVAALQAARDQDIDAAISFQTTGGMVYDERGEPTEPLEAAVLAVAPFNPLFISINCVSAAEGYDSLRRIRTVMDEYGIDIPLAFYVQAEGYADEQHPSYAWNYEGAADPAGDYLHTVGRYLGTIAGIGAFGGCCGTRPDFTQLQHTYIHNPEHFK